MAAIGSIDRSVAIFDLYISGNYELSPTDVSNLTGISISTAFRTISALANANMLVKSTTRGKYRLSSKFLDLARSYMSNLNLVDVALPHMEKMKDKINETLGLFAMVNNGRECIAKVDGGKDIRRVLTVGYRGAIYAGSPSKVLLAYLPDDKIIEILKPIEMTKITNLTKTNIEDIMQDILEVRQNGYSITRGEETEHSFAVSTPIWDYKGNVIAAVSIVGITIYLTKKLEKEYIELAKQLAADISYDMGYLN